eukprot:6468432-Amphidinium_carterae.2
MLKASGRLLWGSTKNESIFLLILRPGHSALLYNKAYMCSKTRFACSNTCNVASVQISLQTCQDLKFSPGNHEGLHKHVTISVEGAQPHVSGTHEC